MNDPIPDLPMTLPASRRPTLIFLLVSLAFTAYGVVMIRDGVAHGFPCFAFFGFCALVFIGLLHPRSSYLTLTESGFVYCSYFRSTRHSWSQVSEFGVDKAGLGRKVGWHFQPAASKGAGGFEAMFPDSYVMPAEELAELMERLRVHHAPKETESDAEEAEPAA